MGFMSTPGKRPSVKGKKIATRRVAESALGATASAPAHPSAVSDPSTEPSSDSLKAAVSQSYREGESESSNSEDRSKTASSSEGVLPSSQGASHDGALVVPGVAKASEELATIASQEKTALARFEQAGAFSAPDIESGPADSFDLGDFGDEPVQKGPLRKKSSRSGELSKAKKAATLPSSKEEGRLSDSSPAKDGEKAPKGGMFSSIRNRAKKKAASSKGEDLGRVRPAAEQKASDYSPEEERAKGARLKAALRARRRRILAWSAAVFVVAVLVGSGVLFWNTYLRYDDAADIQGEWQVIDGSSTVVIDSDSIRMLELLDYEYTLDTWAKTIDFSFTDLSGTGSYSFSDDRRVLIIKEGEGDDQTTLSLVKISDNAEAEPRIVDESERITTESLSGSADQSGASGEADASADQPVQEEGVSDGEPADAAAQDSSPATDQGQAS